MDKTKDHYYSPHADEFPIPAKRVQNIKQFIEGLPSGQLFIEPRPNPYPIRPVMLEREVDEYA